MAFSIQYAALIIAIVFAVASCSDEQSIETPEGTLSVQEDGSGISVTSQDGSVVIKGNENAGHIKITTEDGDDIEVAYNKDTLTKDFPVDIPIYEPSDIVMNQVFKGGQNAMATLSTGDAPAKVAAFYKKTLQEKGWAVGGEMSVGGMVMLQGKKGSAHLNLSIMPESGATKINIAKTTGEG